MYFVTVSVFISSLLIQRVKGTVQMIVLRSRSQNYTWSILNPRSTSWPYVLHVAGRPSSPVQLVHAWRDWVSEGRGEDRERSLISNWVFNRSLLLLLPVSPPPGPLNWLLLFFLLLPNQQPRHTSTSALSVGRDDPINPGGGGGGGSQRFDRGRRMVPGNERNPDRYIIDADPRRIKETEKMSKIGN